MVARLYLRTPSDCSDVLATETRILEDYCADRGWQIGSTHVERGMSLGLSSRPALCDALEIAQPGDVLVMRDMTRLARNAVDVAQVLAWLVDKNVGWVEVDSGGR